MNANDIGATEMMANISLAAILQVALVMTVFRLALLRTGAWARESKRMGLVRVTRAFAEILESLILAGVLVFMIIRPFLFQAFFIPSASMEKTLLGHDAGTDPITGIAYTDTVHDRLFVNKLQYRYGDPNRGDIIVFKAPAAADRESPAKGLPAVENTLIKRVIAVPGDTISIHDGAVWLMKQGAKEFVRQTEPYVNEPMDDPQPDEAHYGVHEPETIPPGKLFVMGDNRNHSNDGRFWGLLDRYRVIGKASLIFFPLNRIRAIH